MKTHDGWGGTKIVTLIWFSCMIIFFITPGCSMRPVVKRPKNVILITIDTFRPDHLSCYGYPRKTTPVMDEIAAQGVVFKTVISSAPWTSPGMISIFTGMNPSVHGVNARGRSLLPGIETIFDVFKNNGRLVPDITYLTNMPNFAHLGLDPKERKVLAKSAFPGHELITWIKENKENRFFVWYHYRFLHLPYLPDDEFNLFVKDEDLALLNTPELQTVQKEVVIPKGVISFTKKQQKVVIDLYDGQLRQLDSLIKKIHDTMVQTDLSENTLLVITADHGEEFFEHGFIGHASTAIHATMYDEVLKIPLILYAPSYFKENKEIDRMVRQIDIMPTILEVSGFKIPKNIQGKSLLPLINGKTPKKDLPAISESNMGGYQSSPELEKILLHSFRTRDYKLIRIREEESESLELFDLVNDPEEKENIVKREPEKAAQLANRLDIALKEMNMQRLALEAKENQAFLSLKVPEHAVLEKPVILSPENDAALKIDQSGKIVIQWTGRKENTYVIEYSAGEGWRNLTGKIPAYGNNKVFGPLPKEALEPLPDWNPYRIRISPYGQEAYWSDWVEFSISLEE